MEGIAVKRDKLVKVVVDSEVQLKESESRLEESKMRAIREREAIKELEEELLVYKKEAVEQHEKGFNKDVKQARFFAKDLDMGLFDPFKDMKDGDLLDEEEIAAEEDVVEKEQSAE